MARVGWELGSRLAIIFLAGSHMPVLTMSYLVAPYNPNAPIPEGSAWVGHEIQSANVSTGSSNGTSGRWAKSLSMP